MVPTSSCIATIGKTGAMPGASTSRLVGVRICAAHAARVTPMASHSARHAARDVSSPAEAASARQYLFRCRELLFGETRIVRGGRDRIGPHAHTQATSLEPGLDADWKEAQHLIARDRPEQRVCGLEREQLRQPDPVERDTGGPRPACATRSALRPRAADRARLWGRSGSVR